MSYQRKENNFNRLFEKGNENNYEENRRNHFSQRIENPHLVPLLKGSCIWFAKNNWTDRGDKPLRKCRNGSFCKYLHLTGEECQYIVDHYNESEECIDCKYKYSQDVKTEEKTESKKIMTSIPEGNRPKIFDDLENKELWDKIRREMPCFTCRDTRKMLSRRKFNKKAQLRNWCDCPQEVRFNSTVQHYQYHPNGEKDAWVCSNCNCICQVG